MDLQFFNSQVQVFTDGINSYGHVGVGFLAGYLGPKWGLAITAAFVGYQLSQSGSVSWSRTGGEVLEFAIGAALAAMVSK